jgi:hypothetical protein
MSCATRCVRRVRARAQLLHERALLGDVGHDALGGIRRRRGAQVRDVVEQRMVVLVADRGDDRGGCRGHRAQQAFVAEAEQGLRIAAAAAMMITSTSGSASSAVSAAIVSGTQRSPCTAHGSCGSAPRPAQFGVAVHILLGVAALTGDEADELREEREALLARGRTALRPQLPRSSSRSS